MDVQTVGSVVTVALFAAIGVVVAWSFPVPVTRRTWIVLLLVAVLGMFVGINTSMVSVFGYAIVLRTAISSCLAAIVVALIVRTLACYTRKGVH